MIRYFVVFTAFVLLLSSSIALSTDLSSVPDEVLPQDISLPEMAEIADVSKKKKLFFDFLTPIVTVVNDKTQAERALLKTLETKLSQGRALEYWQTQALIELGDYYKVEENIGSRAYFSEMFLRVDTIPASLVLAQAANESAWGTSRFAVEGNNLFGQWCFVEGCGLVPSGRNDDASHEVKVFDSVSSSVAAYFRNLNTHTQYQSLRNIRVELRQLALPLDSTYLAWGLEGYSTRGVLYVQELIEMIKHNRLQKRDIPAFYAQNEIRVTFD